MKGLRYVVPAIMASVGVGCLCVVIWAVSSMLSMVSESPAKKYAEGDKIVLVLGEVEGMIVSTSWIHGENGYKVRILTKGPNGQVTVTEQIIREFEIKRKTR